MDNLFSFVNTCYYYGIVGFVLGCVFTSWIFKFLPESTNEKKDFQPALASDDFLNKLKNKDIYNALGGKYDEEAKIFLFEGMGKSLLANVGIENYYSNHWPKEVRRIRVNFLPAFVEEIKCQFFIGWTNEGSEFKGAILIEGEEYDKKIIVDDLRKKNIFEANFKVLKDSSQQRYISFFIEPDSEVHNKFWHQIREGTNITLHIISFKTLIVNVLL